MTYVELKDAIFNIVSEFYAGATVIWAEQINTRPKLPYITLKTNGITRDTFISEDAEGTLYYNASTTLEMNLYTKGLPIGTGENSVINYVNTATSDMADFFKYIDSDKGILIQEEKGITIMLSPPIRDLTELQNDKMYQYRAYSESTISFADLAEGEYGLLNQTLPNISGGGNEEMATTEVEAIDDITIEGGNEE